VSRDAWSVPLIHGTTAGVNTPDAGLCDTCEHSKCVESPRGSGFRLCLLHIRDARYAKYPRLPVIQCSGYVRRPPE
jgi:hypothetical protein